MSKSFSFVLTLNILWFSSNTCYEYMRHIAQNTLDFWHKHFTRSVATRLRYAGIVNDRYIANFLEIVTSGGARVFAARGKCMCCPLPTHPVAHLQVCRHLRGTFQVYIFKKCSNFSIFFTVNISTIFSHPKVPRRKGTPLDTPLAAPPIRSAINILMVTMMAMVWTVNSTLSWGVYNCLT